MMLCWVGVVVLEEHRVVVGEDATFMRMAPSFPSRQRKFSTRQTKKPYGSLIHFSKALVMASLV